MKLYKPNPRNTGHAASFSVTSSGKSQGIYVEIIKQATWNDSTKTGTFDSSKENKINLKFTPAEIAGMMIICQRQKGQAKFFHNTGEITSSITFGVWNDKEGNPKGIALGVSKGEKKASVPFTFDEAFLFLEWCKFAVNRIFVADYTERKKKLEKLQESKIE
jgi:hypothetical protein